MAFRFFFADTSSSRLSEGLCTPYNGDTYILYAVISSSIKRAFTLACDVFTVYSSFQNNYSNASFNSQRHSGLMINYMVPLPS